MNEQNLKIEKLAPNCGGEVLDIDLAHVSDEKTITALKAALAEHGVLFFRQQDITPAQQKELCRRFGELHLHPAWPRLVEGHPEVMEIYADKDTTRIAGEEWHSDVSCDLKPPLGTMLYLIETPPEGGDTLFANTCAAFEALSEPMRNLLDGLTAVHDGEPVYRQGYGEKAVERISYPRAEHPVVRTHPVNGRKGLFVNRTFTTKIVELTQRESDALLAMLFTHIEHPLFQCRFRWQSDVVAFWDNRVVQHLALWDYFPHRRRGHRVTIEGEVPF
ncbi:MAG: taurine dioxygenase [Candidatus Latescibacteria bacterium]|jgi:taurine dioxygenase|nr:taurine dioxygenase [Candidatus Latescibacterota bacterium]MBT4137529.1 taurine dioxygenase [Candidatus Latescibacterota bacterium]MBT5829105.1 taurine dioxygenase [Candidatus Latescibacterota bacterium]